MEKSTIINEIAFEKNCSVRKATEVYEKYKKDKKLDKLIKKLRNHEEV